MKILHIGDGRNGLNWGARGASIALSQMLSRIADEVLTIGSTKNVATGTILPERWAKFLYVRRGYLLPRLYVHLEKLLGAKFDFVEPDPQKGLENILRYREDNDRLDTFCKQVQRVDAVVVDGDGTPILKAQRRGLSKRLTFIELAHHFDTPAYFVNSMISDCPIEGRNHQMARWVADSLLKCQGIGLRDARSIAILKEIEPRVKPELIPDSLFNWYHYMEDLERNLPANGDFLLPHKEVESRYFSRLRFDEPYICIGGGAGAARNHERATSRYCRLVRDLKELDMNVYLTPACVGDAFLYDVAKATNTPIVPASVPILIGAAILAQARLYVSGRYHPSIMAALGGTPEIFLNSDSHKTQSLQELLGYDQPSVFSAFPTEAECGQIAEKARLLLDKGSALRNQIIQHAERRAGEALNVLNLISS